MFVRAAGVALTVTMHNTRRLRKSLHPEHSPEVNGRVRVLPFRRVPTEHQQIVAQNADQGPGGQLWRQALDLNGRGIALSVDHLERHRCFPDDTRQLQGAVHDEATATTKVKSFFAAMRRYNAHR